MTIKSTLSKTSCEKKELPFPKLMQNRQGAVFFCPDRYTSLKVSSTLSPPLDIGRYQGCAYCDQYEWKDYKGSVCLENDKDCC